MTGICSRSLDYPLGPPSAPAGMIHCPCGTTMAGVPQPVPLRNGLGLIPGTEPDDADLPVARVAENRQGPSSPLAIFMRT